MSFVRTGAIVAGVALAGLAAAPAFATGDHGNSGNPKGNNGTVKIENLELEDDNTPENNPHQECTFNVEWFGYDAGDDIISKVTFELHAPTNTESHVLSVFDGNMTPVVGHDEVKLENDEASGAGNDKDGSETYTLRATGEPNANQGYHVKITVDTPRSKGNTTKSKVFWFENCGTEEPPASETPTPSTPPVGEEPSEEPSETPSEEPTDEPTEATPVSDETEPAGEESSAAPAAGDEDSEVPTNIDAGLAGESDAAVPAMWPLLAMLAGAAAAGTALVVVLRRRAAALVRND
ncbi:hypothetical protein [Nocardioides albus]|uniref:Uncharacterized protein n=1 Tax=Nocardioides albus TaxID=1841 RepID=A0A7W5A266_9ACTN|nr:hypothetical protein [Nocardioides albus]MBB3088099.1 hypothetical protein [Nocardioides albus]